MWSWCLSSNDIKKGQIYLSQCIQSNEGNIYKNWESKSFLGQYSSEDIHNITNHEISDSNIKWDVSTTQLWNDMLKIELLKELHILVRFLNKFKINLDIAKIL